jgi:hypothetical protein
MKDSRRLEELEKCEYLLQDKTLKPIERYGVEEYKRSLKDEKKSANLSI